MFQRKYLDSRYRPLPRPTKDATQWLSTVDYANIGINGFAHAYPLAGPKLHNRVEFVEVTTPHGGADLAKTCGEWRTALEAGHYGYVILAVDPVNRRREEAAGGTLAVTQLPWEPWTRSDPRAHLVVETPYLEVFELDAESSRGADRLAGC